MFLGGSLSHGLLLSRGAGPLTLSSRHLSLHLSLFLCIVGLRALLYGLNLLQSLLLNLSVGVGLVWGVLVNHNLTLKFHNSNPNELKYAMKHVRNLHPLTI